MVTHVQQHNFRIRNLAVNLATSLIWLIKCIVELLLNIEENTF
jgi:hypothetical protein